MIFYCFFCFLLLNQCSSFTLAIHFSLFSEFGVRLLTILPFFLAVKNYKARVRQISDNVIRDLSSNTGSLQTLERIKPSVVGQPTLNSNDFAAAGNVTQTISPNF